MQKTFKKYFTPEEAQKTLPLVKKITKDILDYSFQIRTIAESLTGDPDENPEIKKLVSEMNYCMKELEELGCYYKDWSFSVGLVDFPAIIEDEEALLCWRSDEEEIVYYHTVNEGFAGRRLIPTKYFTV